MGIKNRIVAIGIWLPVWHLWPACGIPMRLRKVPRRALPTLQKLEVRLRRCSNWRSAPLRSSFLATWNEDGKVDAADLVLIQQLAAEANLPAAAICPAAADLLQNGKIDTARMLLR